MNQEFNMKKLAALLLGTVIGIAFTASDAFADKASDAVKNYWNSNDGRTGGYLGLSYHKGNISDVEANYLRKGADATWALDNGKGAQSQFGFDFGKIRFDWRLGGLYSTVESIDGTANDPAASDEAVIAYSTLNVGLDLYRFEVVKQSFVNIAITPYVGAGYGYGGGWMTGKKVNNANIAEPAGHGKAHSYEAGILVNLTDWAGITLGYNYLSIDLEGHSTSTSEEINSHLGSVGVRFTY